MLSQPTFRYWVTVIDPETDTELGFEITTSTDALDERFKAIRARKRELGLTHCETVESVPQPLYRLLQRVIWKGYETTVESIEVREGEFNYCLSTDPEQFVCEASISPIFRLATNLESHAA